MLLSLILFGPNGPHFEYTGLRYRPVFEKAAILVHELKHRKQARKNKIIGTSKKLNRIKHDEIEAFHAEYKMFKHMPKYYADVNVLEF